MIRCLLHGLCKLTRLAACGVCYWQICCRRSSLAANGAMITRAHPSKVVPSFRCGCSRLYVLCGRLKNRLACALLSVRLVMQNLFVWSGEPYET
jgi:hypothetical protein